MKSTYSAGVCAAAVIGFNMVAFAQATPPQTPSTTTAAAQQGTSADQAVTIAGCIQREADYRRARDAGRGGVAGTGVGAGNEFVLVNASMSAGTGAGTAATTGNTPGAATGTAGGTAAGVAYELTGANEGQAAQHVGRRVEISGKIKAGEVESTGRPTGGATAGKPPAGIDIASQDLKLRELEVTSIREVAGTCPGL